MRLLAPLIIALGTTLASFASACSYDWTYSDDDGGSSGSGKTTDGGKTEENDASEPPPITNECTLAKPCSKGICTFFGDLCGGVGKCVEAECSDVEVCTCEGLRLSGCVAAKEGKAIDESGASCPAKELFDCYGTKCVVGKQWCDAKSVKCIDYPTSCKPDCSCPDLPQAPCSCSADAKGNAIIKC